LSPRDAFSASISAPIQLMNCISWRCAKGFRRDMTRANSQALKRLVANGALLRPFSHGVMEACLKASNEVNAETSAADANFKKIYDSQMDFRNDGNLWWQVAEYSYETFMIRTRPKG